MTDEQFNELKEYIDKKFNENQSDRSRQIILIVFILAIFAILILNALP